MSGRDAAGGRARPAATVVDPRPAPRRRFGWPAGIRGRSALVAVLVVLVAMLAGGTGLILILQQNLERSANSAAEARGAEVAALVRDQGVATAVAALVGETRNDEVVQIIDPSHTVLGVSDPRAAAGPMSEQFPVPGRTATADVDIDYLGEGGGWTVVATGVATSGHAYVVQVGVPVRVEKETVQTVAIFLFAAAPLLLGGTAFAVWLLLGRALRSVERIRSEVATINSQRLAQRVDVPPTQDEVAALAVTMNVMLDRLEAAHRVQRAFVSDASHELRSPLATLTTAAELATRADAATRDRLLATITAELARVRVLVENLMTLARADADDLVVPRGEVDLDDLVDDEARRLRTTSTRTVTVQVLDPVRVTGDNQRLAQALRNLVDNAERHAASTVRLSVHTVGPDAVLWVDNDGPTIHPANRERVFDRFVRLDDSRSRDAGGSGLGLAISRTAVESHGGRVQVVDAPDGWCRFELRLPLPQTEPGGSVGSVTAPGRPLSLDSGQPDDDGFGDARAVGQGHGRGGRR